MPGLPIATNTGRLKLGEAIPCLIQILIFCGKKKVKR
jgi:hypothetical protein